MPLLLLRHWKLIAGAVLIASAFVGGWKLNGDRWEAKWNAAVLSRQQAVAAERDRLQAEFEQQRGRDQDAQRKLSTDLLALRQANDRLQEELERADLVKTEPGPAVGPSGQVQQCERLANPFTAQFARLFNRAARGGVGLPGADPPG